MYDTDFLDLPALHNVQGRVRLPGSKSISNRVLLLAALCEGQTLVHDVLDSDDTRVMLQALQQLGCVMAPQAGDSLLIEGLPGRTRAPAAEFFLGNAGTAMRPLTAALAVLGGDYRLSGIPRMHERPIGDLVDALRALGCSVDYLGNTGYPPLHIGQPTLRLDGPIAVRGDVSSQFLTALLMALPLAVGVPGSPDAVVEVSGELISRPYIDITLQMMARFGVQVQQQGGQRFVIPAGSRYRSPGVIHVEADASSASYFIAAAALGASDEGLRIEGLDLNAVQGDIRFVEAARAMGAQVEGGENFLQVRQDRWPLTAIDLDCNHIPDAAMTLAVMALYADGPSTLRNIASWRVKETDRLSAMATELRKLGATVEEGEDWLRVQPLAAGQWRAASLHTYDDHRMAMCGSLAAFNPDQLPVRIEDPKCVAKTFPDYFEALFSVAQPVQAVPVICVDGPTASGKGTLASALAAQLGYHYLDSGALYRLTGLAARRAGLLDGDDDVAGATAELAARMSLRFEGDRVWLDGEEVSAAIRSEAAGMDASRVSAWPEVRQALLQLQRDAARLPGLVTDGRDMGTVVFPQAPLKVFLTAEARQRAERRYRQLQERGQEVTIDQICADLQARDARDQSRAPAPLKPAQDALQLDNSQLSIEQSVEQVLDWWQQGQAFTP